MMKILIIKPSALGDIVLSLPVLSALRRSFPESEIHWLVRKEFAPLLEGHPHLNEIILFDRKYLGKAWKNPKALGSLVSLIMRLRKENFDVVLDLQGLFRTAGISLLSGCKRRLGPASGREFSHLLYNIKVKQDQKSIHVVDYYLKIAESAGANIPSVEFILPRNTEAEEAVGDMLAEAGVKENNYAVFIPGSAHTDKCWPVKKFAELADRVVESFGFSIIMAGTQPESALAEEVQDKAKAEIINLAGKTDIPKLVALLRDARLVVSNDTGPGHIAAALGKPIVMLFGRSNPARVAPYHRPECIAAIEQDSRGTAIHNFEAKYDIRHITVDKVFEKVCAQIRT